jgi:hypothetical protein
MSLVFGNSAQICVPEKKKYFYLEARNQKWQKSDATHPTIAISKSRPVNPAAVMQEVKK